MKKITRSDLRYALYRMKKNTANDQHQQLAKLVVDQLPHGESWSTFANRWDVFVDSNGKITVIRPEDDYSFVFNTCLEKAMCERQGVDMEPTPRQANVIQIVELNMLEGKMTWSNFNRAWSVHVDPELKRISTHLATTVVNQVTDEMIAASVQSDGSPHQGTPGIAVIEMSEPTPLTDAERAHIEQLMLKSQR